MIIETAPLPPKSLGPTLLFHKKYKSTHCSDKIETDVHNIIITPISLIVPTSYCRHRLLFESYYCKPPRRALDYSKLQYGILYEWRYCQRSRCRFRILCKQSWVRRGRLSEILFPIGKLVNCLQCWEEGRSVKSYEIYILVISDLKFIKYH